MHIFVDIYLDYQKHNDDTLVDVNTPTNLIQFPISGARVVWMPVVGSEQVFGTYTCPDTLF